MKKFKNPFWNELCDRLQVLQGIEDTAYEVLRSIDSIKETMEEYEGKVADGEYDKALQTENQDANTPFYADSMALKEAFGEMDEVTQHLKSVSFV